MGDLFPRRLMDWWKRFGKPDCCFYCGTQLVYKKGEPCGNSKTIDHVKAKAKGGKNVKSNRVKACYSCNSRKGALGVKQFRKVFTGRADGRFFAELGYAARPRKEKV